MNWDAVGAIGEIVGALAVVASLLYLAIQTRANASALRSNAVWNAETIFGDSNYMLAREPELAVLINRALVEGARVEDFSETELVQLHFLVRGVLQYMQAQHSLWKEGALSDDYWQRRRRWTCSFVASPVLNPVWEDEISQQLVDPNFEEEIKKGLEESLAPIDLGRRAIGK